MEGTSLHRHTSSTRVLTQQSRNRRNLSTNSRPRRPYAALERISRFARYSGALRGRHARQSQT
jgi:hypothetical protein